MDCNKEEAIRAKDIAVKKMQNRDFSGALKMAMKAQKLFQDLENISRMIMVCEVHCAAEKKLFGNEMDWYAILKVELTADEATIKKQYRKFALGLHPDKNQFPGAEAAFKLIADAQRILLDQGKRSSHDMKRKVAVNRPTPAAACRPTQKPSCYPHASVQNNFRSNFPGTNSQQLPRQPNQTGFSNGRPTFWTKCPYCLVTYQYYSEVLYKSLRCQNCTKAFTAYDSGAAPRPSTTHHPKFPQERVVPNPGACKGDQGAQQNFSARNAKAASSPSAACTSQVGKKKLNGKRRRKQTVKSSDSCGSESSSEPEEEMVIDDNGDVVAGKNFCYQTEQNLRRSGRHKQHVSYGKDASDKEDMASPPKKAKRATVGSEEMPKEDKLGSAGELKEDQKAMKHGKCTSAGASLSNGMKETGKRFDKERTKMSNRGDDDALSDSSFKETKEPESFACPEPEFYDFDKDKKEGCFAVGQIWALYDPLDSMPRFYARIGKVYSVGFKLRITWLEPDPDDENEIEWVSEGLPVSCGKFRHGVSDNSEDCLMFSHMVSWEKGTSRNTYRIFPRKGETWALFKDWNIKWKSNAETDQKYKYEFVEILSDYVEGSGIHVAYLAKVKGFVSVFCQMRKEGVDEALIPSNELFRFSHRVPSIVLTGKERKGVPKGSFELDPASLPDPAEIVAAIDFKVDDDGRDLKHSCLSSSENVIPMKVSEEHDPPASSPKAFEIPESEFYNFDADKSPEKFHVGDIWALYSDEDGLPKYYGKINRVKPNPTFRIHVRWLAACRTPKITQWSDRDMPTCCGRFKTQKHAYQVYTSTDSFSHKLNAKFAGKKDEYLILPRKGDIWALYGNWTSEIKCSDLESCKYDIVHVLEETDLYTKVLVLERVDGFKSVFKPKVKGRSNVTVDIPRVNQKRFSHQIPFFQLTNERNGSLRGFWEVDTAALPVHYFSSLSE